MALTRPRYLRRIISHIRSLLCMREKPTPALSPQPPPLLNTATPPPLPSEDSSSFRLFDLPRELRDIINEHAVNGNDCPSVYPRVRLSKDEIALLKTCKQVKYEATPIYYRIKTFYFTRCSDASRWWKALSPTTREHIRDVKLITDADSREQLRKVGIRFKPGV